MAEILLLSSLVINLLLFLDLDVDESFGFNPMPSRHDESSKNTTVVLDYCDE